MRWRRRPTPEHPSVALRHLLGGMADTRPEDTAAGVKKASEHEHRHQLCTGNTHNNTLLELTHSIRIIIAITMPVKPIVSTTRTRTQIHTRARTRTQPRTRACEREHAKPNTSTHAHTTTHTHTHMHNINNNNNNNNDNNHIQWRRHQRHRQPTTTVRNATKANEPTEANTITYRTRQATATRTTALRLSRSLEFHLSLSPSLRVWLPHSW